MLTRIRRLPSRPRNTCLIALLYPWVPAFAIAESGRDDVEALVRMLEGAYQSVLERR